MWANVIHPLWRRRPKTMASSEKLLFPDKGQYSVLWFARFSKFHGFEVMYLSGQAMLCCSKSDLETLRGFHDQMLPLSHTMCLVRVNCSSAWCHFDSRTQDDRGAFVWDIGHGCDRKGKKDNKPYIIFTHISLGKVTWPHSGERMHHPFSERLQQARWWI